MWNGSDNFENVGMKMLLYIIMYTLLIIYEKINKVTTTPSRYVYNAFFNVNIYNWFI